MIKVNDLLLNFNDVLYEFYDWDKKDKIYHIKSIDAFYVSKKVLNDFMYNDIKVDNSFLDIIKSKTIIYSNTPVIELKYACILYDKNKACAFLFDKNGKCIKKSHLLFDEEEDLLKKEKSLVNIKYKILKKNNYNQILTRKELMIVNKTLNELIKIKSNDLIKYIYYECFNKYESSSKLALKKIINNINSYDEKTIKIVGETIKILKK